MSACEEVISFVFINKWLNILKPAYDQLPQSDDSDQQIKVLEKESIKVSLSNLIEFPFVKKALENNELVLHGLWHDIGTGELEMLDPEQSEFIKV